MQAGSVPYQLLSQLAIVYRLGNGSRLKEVKGIGMECYWIHVACIESKCIFLIT